MMSGDWNVVPCRGTAYEKALAERCFGGFQERKGHCGRQKSMEEPNHHLVDDSKGVPTSS